jgi:ParB-like chromosome segregation protein Spo0J
MILIWQKILKENLSVRKVEKAVSSPKRQNKILNRLELEISQKIGTKVEISSNRSSKGNVKIYFDKVTFDRVVEKLKSIKSD